MYEFMGRVRLDSRDEVYHIYVDGNEIDNGGYTRSQLCNPKIASTRFVQEISRLLNENVNRYLLSRGYNHVMGCKVIGFSCGECKAMGKNTSDAWCFNGAWDDEQE